MKEKKWSYNLKEEKNVFGDELVATYYGNPKNQTAICKCCSTVFVKRHQNQKYCSKQCRDKHQVKNLHYVSKDDFSQGTIWVLDIKKGIWKKEVRGEND